jgi:anti-sigma regulatory factor (Ser/Thr protein kinase)
MVVVNQRRELARLGDRVDAFGRACGLSADDTACACLTLDELVSNVIKYAYEDTQEHQIHVTVQVDGNLMTISIEDDGKPFNPLEAPVPNLEVSIEEWPTGGLGVHIVKSIADKLEYRREHGHNIVMMEKRIRPGQSGR